MANWLLIQQTTPSSDRNHIFHTGRLREDDSNFQASCKIGEVFQRCTDGNRLSSLLRLVVNTTALLTTACTTLQAVINMCLDFKMLHSVMYIRTENIDKSNALSRPPRRHSMFLIKQCLQWKKALRETQTLRAGCSKAEPKIFAPLQTPFPVARDGQNLISWRWSLPLPINPVWWRSMHAISSYRGNRPTNKQTHTNPQRGPITIHCAAAS